MGDGEIRGGAREVETESSEGSNERGSDGVIREVAVGGGKERRREGGRNRWTPQNGKRSGKGGGEGSIVDDVFDVMEGTCSGEEEESRRRCPTGEGDSCVGRGNTELAT